MAGRSYPFLLVASLATALLSNAYRESRTLLANAILYRRPKGVTDASPSPDVR